MKEEKTINNDVVGRSIKVTSIQLENIKRNSQDLKFLQQLGIDNNVNFGKSEVMMELDSMFVCEQIEEKGISNVK